MIDKTSEIKPCPNCGTAVEQNWPLWKHKTNRQCVWCRNCDMTGPMVVGSDAAITAWNRLAELIARAEKAERERDAILKWAFMMSGDSLVRRIDDEDDAEEIWQALNEDGDYVTGNSYAAAIRLAAGLED